MKTQINNLVNGSKTVIGRSENFKGGSNYDLRSELAAKVQSEHFEIMNVVVNGVDLELKRSESLSGKTVTFSSTISKLQYKSILGFDCDINNYESFLSFQINDDMTCQISKSARKNENSQWKFRGYTFVAESMVEIK